MARSLPWFRFYTEAITDRKIRRLDPAHRWLWVTVLSAARMSPTPGELYLSDGMPLTADDLADLAALPLPTIAAGMTALVDAGMVIGSDPWTVPAFAARQHESDTSTERVRRHRAKGNAAATPDVTGMERFTTVPVTPSDTESDTDTESSSSQTVVAILDAVADARLAAQKRTGAVRSPQAWRKRVRANMDADGDLVARAVDLSARFDDDPRRIAEVIEGVRPSTGLRKRRTGSGDAAGVVAGSEAVGA